MGERYNKQKQRSPTRFAAFALGVNTHISQLRNWVPDWMTKHQRTSSWAPESDRAANKNMRRQKEAD